MGQTAKRFLRALGMALAVCACGDPAPQATRPPPGSNLMLRAPVSGLHGLEVLISDVVIPPGVAVPRHTHPGEAFLYVLEGSAVHVEEGRPDRLLEAGDTYVIPPGAAHAPRGGPNGARAIVFRLHKAGEPERLPALERGAEGAMEAGQER
ncbi:MAG: cupin domain-containing protein [Alphaproteobacteria bacterium]